MISHLDQPQNEEQLKQEQVPQSELNVEGVKNDCESVIGDVKVHYQEAVKKFPQNEGIREGLEVHNGLVLDEAVKIANMLGLDDREKAIAMIATILHDSAKLDDEMPLKALLNHHTEGAKVAEVLAKKFVGKTVNGYEVTEDMVPEIANAVKRHQNHPFLVAIFNKGKRFEEPETRADVTVYLADMMANIGFKNVGLRLPSPLFFPEDIQKSMEKSDNHLVTALDNVFKGKLGVENLVHSVFYDEKGNRLANLADTKDVEKYMIEKIESAKKVYDELVIRLPELEAEMTAKSSRSKGEMYSHSTWQTFAELEGKTEKGAGIKFMTFKINKLIGEIGSDLGIDKKTVDSFKM